LCAGERRTPFGGLSHTGDNQRGGGSLTQKEGRIEILPARGWNPWDAPRGGGPETATANGGRVPVNKGRQVGGAGVRRANAGRLAPQSHPRVKPLTAYDTNAAGGQVPGPPHGGGPGWAGNPTRPSARATDAEGPRGRASFTGGGDGNGSAGGPGDQTKRQNNRIFRTTGPGRPRLGAYVTRFGPVGATQGGGGGGGPGGTGRGGTGANHRMERRGSGLQPLWGTVGGLQRGVVGPNVRLNGGGLIRKGKDRNRVRFSTGRKKPQGFRGGPGTPDGRSSGGNGPFQKHRVVCSGGARPRGQGLYGAPHGGFNPEKKLGPDQRRNSLVKYGGFPQVVLRRALGRVPAKSQGPGPFFLQQYGGGHHARVQTRLRPYGGQGPSAGGWDGKAPPIPEPNRGHGGTTDGETDPNQGFGPFDGKLNGALLNPRVPGGGGGGGETVETKETGTQGVLVFATLRLWTPGPGPKREGTHPAFFDGIRITRSGAKKPSLGGTKKGDGGKPGYGAGAGHTQHARTDWTYEPASPPAGPGKNKGTGAIGGETDTGGGGNLRGKAGEEHTGLTGTAAPCGTGKAGGHRRQTGTGLNRGPGGAEDAFFTYET